jgi:hypothetical protein
MPLSINLREKETYKMAAFLPFIGGAQGISQIVGAGFSIAGGRKSAREARRARREQRQFQQQALKVAKGSLAFAQDQFDLFRPALEQARDFFNENTLEDIASGRVISQQTERQVEAFRAGQEQTLSEVERGLARRGIADQPLAELIRGQLGQSGARTVSNILATGAERDISRQLDFSRQGLPAAAGVQGGQQFLSQLLTGAAGAAGQRATASSALAGQGGQQAASLLTQFLGGLGGGQ